MSVQEILSAGTASQAPAGMVPLDHLTVIEAKGADAADFLQSQLTQDVAKLDPDHACLAGYCTAKGRMLASALLWRARPDPADPVPRLLLVVDAGLAAALQKRLSMFVLRAKVKLAVTPLKVAGAWGGAETLQSAAGGPLPTTDWVRADLPSGSWIAAPRADAGPARWWWIGDDGQLAALTQAAGIAHGGADAWRAADIAAGIPWITAATQDLFVPQMVNFELIGGVSFTKGCYPGQEVVARSHYLGKVKRRTFHGRLAQADAQADAQALVAADVFQEGDEQPCGRIVNAAPDGDGVAILYESTLAAGQGELPLHAGSPIGPVIAPQALPYALAGNNAQG